MSDKGNLKERLQAAWYVLRGRSVAYLMKFNPDGSAEPLKQPGFCLCCHFDGGGGRRTGIEITKGKDGAEDTVRLNAPLQYFPGPDDFLAKE